ncbi:MAG TPA: hypothetical protein VMN36_13760 [Verrucomicrobiales bacterium]|nr:hypothetical protein [Verrucomicrobiales bacterium]
MSTPLVSANELPPNLKNLWDRASKAFRVQNYDYVVQLLAGILKDAPTFLDGRRALRKAQIARSRTQKKTLSGRFTTPNLSLMRIRTQVSKDPIAAIVAIEEELDKDPVSHQGNQLLYEAALAAGLPEIASFALETLREANPKDQAILKQLAHHYLTHEEPGKAVEMYNLVLAINASDLEAVKGVTDASARESMKKNKVEEGGMRRDDAERIRLEQTDRQHLTPEQAMKQLEDWGARYAEDPNNLAVVKRIASLYERLEDWGNAMTYYDWAYQISDSDSALEQKVRELQEKKRDVEFRVMEEEIANHPDAPDIDEKRKRFDELRRERASQQITEARRRSEANPTDPQIRYDLGRHLFAADQFTEAIPELQRAKNNPHVRTQALLLLGRCFERKNMLDLAVNQLAEAEKDLAVLDNTKKEVLYEKALVLQRMGRTEEYLENLKQIYEADYGYRDVAKRVESSYQTS